MWSVSLPKAVARKDSKKQYHQKYTVRSYKEYLKYFEEQIIY